MIGRYHIATICMQYVTQLASKAARNIFPVDQPAVEMSSGVVTKWLSGCKLERTTT